MEENNKSKSWKNLKLKKIWLLTIVVLFCALIIGIFINDKIGKKSNTDNLTNPVLDTKIGDTVMGNKNINLEYYLQNLEKAKIANGEITDLSVYFRNMNNGNRFGLKEKELFSPASLMKLPLLLAYYKKSQTEPGFLEKKLTFTINGSADLYKQNIVPEHRLEVNKDYSIKEIIDHMIKYSDNEASIFLERHISEAEFKKVFTDIGIEFPPFIDGAFDNNIRVVDYAAFFRVLYNSSYLNRDNSEAVLNLLTKTSFRNGLVAGVSDAGLVVSHKFGERSIWGANGIERMQLHDCGIVYYPDYPYLLCIMTRGYNWEKLENVVQEISSIVYQKVDEAYSLNN